MQYTVIVKNRTTGEPVVMIPCTKREAIKTAKEEAKNPQHQVFVEWLRASDGQRGYLNRNGSNTITGEAW